MANNDWIKDSLYKKFLRRMPIVCVDLVIPINGHYLLVRRGTEPAKNCWWLPGGRLIKGEKLEHAAVRKMKEELGVEGKCGRIVTVQNTVFNTGPHDIPVHSVNIVFEGIVDWTANIVEPGEHELGYGLYKGDEWKLPQYVRDCIGLYEGRKSWL